MDPSGLKKCSNLKSLVKRVLTLTLACIGQVTLSLEDTDTLTLFDLSNSRRVKGLYRQTALAAKVYFHFVHGTC